MKRTITIMLTCAGIAGAMLFAGCKKDNTVSKKDQSLDSLTGKATISGVVYLAYDVTQKPKVLAKEIAAGAVITLTYNPSDLAYKLDPNAITYSKSVTATTDAAGKYTITVDANVDGINYTIQPNQFSGNYVDPKDTTSFKAYFNAPSAPVTLKKGDNIYMDLNYNKTPQYIIPN